MIIWETRHQIKEVERLRQRVPIDPPGGVDILPQLNQDITQLLSSLVTRSVAGHQVTKSLITGSLITGSPVTGHQVTGSLVTRSPGHWSPGQSLVAGSLSGSRLSVNCVRSITL